MKHWLQSASAKQFKPTVPSAKYENKKKKQHLIYNQAELRIIHLEWNLDPGHPGFAIIFGKTALTMSMTLLCS